MEQLEKNMWHVHITVIQKVQCEQVNNICMHSHKHIGEEVYILCGIITWQCAQIDEK